MKELFGRLGKQTLIYGLGGAALQAVGLITLPVYTRVFTPSEYGMLEVAIVGSTLLITLVDSGMTSAAQRSYYDYDDTQVSERRSALGTALTTMMVLSLAVAAFVGGFAEPISHQLFGSSSHADLVRIAALSVPLATVATFMRETMRLRFRAGRYVISSLLAAIGTAAAGIVAVKVFGAGISGVMIGLLVGYGLAAVYGVAVAARDVAGRFSKAELRLMVHYGAPLIPAAFSLWGLSFLDRVMLSQLGTFSDTGEYAVGSRYSSLLMFGVVTFLTAYVPFMMSLWQEDADAERLVRARLLTYVTVVFVGGGLVLSLFARELTTILAPQFDRAYQVVGILSVGVVFFAIGSIVAWGIAVVRSTKYIGIYTVVAVVVNVALNFLLIPPWGMIGAAVSATCSYGVLTLLYYRKAQQLYHTPYVTRHALIALLVGCPLMGVGAIPIEPLGLAITIKLATIAVYLLAVWRGKLIGEEELTALRDLTRQLRARRRPAARAAP